MQGRCTSLISVESGGLSGEWPPLLRTMPKPIKKKLNADQRSVLRRRIAKNSKNHGAAFREANAVMAAIKQKGQS